MIGRFYIGKGCCILHVLGNKKENLAEFNWVDFNNLPNCQNKFYAKFSSYMVFMIEIYTIPFEIQDLNFSSFLV